MATSPPHASISYKGKHYVLGDMTTIGRAVATQPGQARQWADIPLEDEQASVQHAIVVVSEGRHRLLDWKSTNGVRVGDKAVLDVALQAGDAIQIGQQTLVYVCDPSITRPLQVGRDPDNRGVLAAIEQQLTGLLDCGFDAVPSITAVVKVIKSISKLGRARSQGTAELKHTCRIISSAFQADRAVVFQVTQGGDSLQAVAWYDTFQVGPDELDTPRWCQGWPLDAIVQSACERRCPILIPGPPKDPLALPGGHARLTNVSCVMASPMGPMGAPVDLVVVVLRTLKNVVELYSGADLAALGLVTGVLSDDLLGAAPRGGS